MRPLWYEFPTDPACVGVNDQYLLGPSLLVAEGRLNTKGRAVASKSKTGRGRATVPIFLLVPQVRLPKRLALAREAERAAEAVPGRVVGKWVEGRTIL